MSALTITYRSVADLKPYARNARTHSRAQIKQIAASITRFGFTNPVLIDDNDQIAVSGEFTHTGRTNAAGAAGHDADAFG